ncbi:putative transcription factor SOX-15 [Vespula maculifrons]|uniref:Uncharacterized protein n=3 Tax=Vespula TaxID=7451 RepID=A0A834JFJ9_VESPE|nr:hypothetical protein HZH66_015503 [Vespula vulgaris]KAF7387703.1 hypothetical protein H0235_018425 [Vespula pensylvanica]
MDAHGWNLAEMCQRYHHGIPTVQSSSPARDPSAAIVQPLPTPSHIEQANNPSYSHYTFPLKEFVLLNIYLRTLHVAATMMAKNETKE